MHRHLLGQATFVVFIANTTQTRTTAIHCIGTCIPKPDTASGRGCSLAQPRNVRIVTSFAFLLGSSTPSDATIILLSTTSVRRIRNRRTHWRGRNWGWRFSSYWRRRRGWGIGGYWRRKRGGRDRKYWGRCNFLGGWLT